MSELPAGWTKATLGDVGVWRGGGTPSKQDDSFWKNGSIPWVSPKDMKQPRVSDSEDHITTKAIDSSATQIIPLQSVLIVTRSGILRHSLPVAVNTREVAINQDLKALTPAAGIEATFVAAQLNAEAQAILSTCAKSGTTVDSIDFARLKAVPIRIAPLAEQHRIVTKIDSLSSKSRRARDQLDHIPRLVETYKRAVLAAAFRGDLTRTWGPAGLSSTTWRSIKWKDAGETLNGRAFPSDSYSPTGIPLLRPGNLAADGTLVWSEKNTKRLPRNFAAQHPKHHICGSEILVNLTAQSLEDQFLGRACLSEPHDEFLLNQRIAVFRPHCMERKYCLYVLKSPIFRSFVDNGLNAGSLIQHVHTKQLAEFVFPVPPVEEQQEIVRRIENAFGWIDRLAAEAGGARKLMDRLDEAILAKAFRGELVPQDPNDEPAEVLLERIRGRRAPKESKTRRKRRQLTS